MTVMIWMANKVPLYETLDEIYRLIAGGSSFYFHCQFDKEPTHGLYDKDSKLFGFKRSIQTTRIPNLKAGDEIIYKVEDYINLQRDADKYQDRPVIICSNAVAVWNVTQKISYDN